ncbi:AAA family ATPase [Bacillus wiedmannii]|uniref:AAA family ATPase n=1 Tax=Bacillus wiedmannii TaxID=1890302 RepID=UPI00159BA11D|nr:AAA family ATPase [Bacillus wiedmannii]
MNKIRIKNLRSLRDTGEIDVKPLTVLVGKNSSGKSTFLRFFPLMKQTLETRTNEPILWYSSRFVDFGSFEESINYKHKKEKICFEFEFTVPKGYFMYESATFSIRRNNFMDMIEDADLNNPFNFKIYIECSEKFVNKIQIQFEDHQLKIEMSSKETLKSLTINNKEYSKGQFFKAAYSLEPSNILPQISYKEDDNYSTFYTERHFIKNLFSNIVEFGHIDINDDEIRNQIKQVIERIPLGSSKEIFENLMSHDIIIDYFLKNPKTAMIDPNLQDNLINNFLGLYLNQIISLCNKYLELSFSSVKYIAPLRASAERYYRIQGLSVDEIDSQGTNIPMMIHNMNSRDKVHFNTWVKENFGFGVTTSFEGGHTSLKIKYDENSDEINLADTGFGYSQILPIILVMWQATKVHTPSSKYVWKSNFYRFKEGFERSMFTIVIEQPELHLHPALQAKLIDTFAQLITKAQEVDINLKIIIETHSETMLNRIGYLIAKKKFDFKHDLVNILIFNKIDAYHSNVESTGYSEKGHLLHWPIGFFSSEDF